MASSLPAGIAARNGRGRIDPRLRGSIDQDQLRLIITPFALKNWGRTAINLAGMKSVVLNLVSTETFRRNWCTECTLRIFRRARASPCPATRNRRGPSMRGLLVSETSSTESQPERNLRQCLSSQTVTGVPRCGPVRWPSRSGPCRWPPGYRRKMAADRGN